MPDTNMDIQTVCLTNLLFFFTLKILGLLVGSFYNKNT
jgi:hypothetical protein